MKWLILKTTKRILYKTFTDVTLKHKYLWIETKTIFYTVIIWIKMDHILFNVQNEIHFQHLNTVLYPKSPLCSMLKSAEYEYKITNSYQHTQSVRTKSNNTVIFTLYESCTKLLTFRLAAVIGKTSRLSTHL